MENNQQSVWQFSDQLRIHTSNLANLSLNDSIWSTSFGAKRTDERRNFDIRVGGQTQINNSFSPSSNDLINYNQHKVSGSDFNINNNNNGFSNDGWKIGSSTIGSQQKNNVGVNGGFNKGVYNSKPSNYNNSNNNNINFKSGGKNKGVEDDQIYGGKSGRKNNNNNYNKNNNGGDNNNNNSNSNSNKNSVDKRFKTLPPSESLPRNETIGGYIFVCNNDTMQENLKRELFGLPPRYRDSVRAITPGLPLFLYNYSTHQLHGIFEALSFGGTNIDPTAWEDKKCHGESRFPAQVRVVTRKICEPLEEDSFRPILHHYDGPKFRLELSIPEVLSLLDVFEESST